MRIVVLGAGSIGSLFGGILSAHYDVVMIGRTEHVKAINTDGLRITGKTDLLVKPSAQNNIDGLAPPRILFITVKSYDTVKAVEDAKAIIGPRTILVSLQNGLGNLETIAKAFPDSPVIGITTSHGARLKSPGIVEHAGSGSTVVGEYFNCRKGEVDEVASLLSQANIEYSITDDLLGEVWSKALVNASINPLAAILRQENGALLTHAGLQDIIQAIIREGVKAAGAEGVRLVEEEVFSRTLDVIVRTAENRCSMLQDIEVGRRTEIDQINGALVIAGGKAGMEMPVNRMLVTLIKAIQNGSQKV